MSLLVLASTARGGFFYLLENAFGIVVIIAFIVGVITVISRLATGKPLDESAAARDRFHQRDRIRRDQERERGRGDQST